MCPVDTRERGWARLGAPLHRFPNLERALPTIRSNAETPPILLFYLFFFPLPPFSITLICSDFSDIFKHQIGLEMKELNLDGCQLFPLDLAAAGLCDKSTGALLRHKPQAAGVTLGGLRPPKKKASIFHSFSEISPQLQPKYLPKRSEVSHVHVWEGGAHAPALLQVREWKSNEPHTVRPMQQY